MVCNLCLLWSVLLGALLHQANSQFSFHILSPEKDPNPEKGLKSFGVNHEASGNVKVGTIAAMVNGGNANYFLLDVVDDPTKSNQISWKSIAEHSSTNDCAESTLSYYAGYRKMFCIDHKRGDIYTTQYFNTTKHVPGTIYYFRLLLTNSFARMKYPNIPHITVVVTSVCDEMTSLLQQITSNCNDDIVEVTSSNRAVRLTSKMLVTGFVGVVYLTQINVNFAEMPVSENAQPLVDGEEFQLYTNVNGHQLPPLKHTFFVGKIQTVYLANPLKTNNLDSVEIFLKRRNGDTRMENIRDSMFQLVLLKPIDYCSPQPNCINMASMYQSEVTKYSLKCVNNDNTSFVPKFASCSENLLASNYTEVKTNFTIQFDLVKDTKTPVLVASRYLPFKNTGGYEINIEKVHSKYTKSKTQYYAVGHRDCTVSTLTKTAPRIFFCINQDSGAVYTTDAINNLPPDEQFTVVVKVQRKNIDFPKQTLRFRMNIHLVSLCTRPSMLYRQLTNAQCNAPCTYVGHFIPTFKPNSLQSTYNVTIKISRPFFYKRTCLRMNPGQKFYIVGLMKSKRASPINVNRIGNFIRFQLSGKYQNTESSYYYRLSYTSFRKFIVYNKNEYFTLSATYNDHSTGTEKLHNFDWADWGVHLVPMDNYCILKPHCIPLFAEYYKYTNAVSYIKSARSDFRAMCGDYDLYGFKTMYGGCGAHFPGPSVIKTDYILQKTGNSYTKMEVIPGSGSPMYATIAYPMKYTLINVKSSPDLTVTSTGPVEAPPECSETFVSGPKRFFCLNQHTGKIYTTSAIAGQLESNVDFELQVRVHNDTVFPIRDVTVTVKLSTVDPCFSATSVYKTLTNCVQYEQKSLFAYQGNSYLFEVPKDYQRIVSLKVPLVNLQTSITNKLNISAYIVVSDVNNSVIYQHRSAFRVYFTDYLEIHIETPLPYISTDAKQINITLYEGDTSGQQTVISRESAPSSGEISLHYIKDFSCSGSCIQKFDEWKTAASKLSPENCKQDRLFYERNFAVCKEVTPEFVHALNLNSATLYSGQDVKISNCVYTSPYKYPKGFWRKNGVSLDAPGKLRRSVDALPNLPRSSVNSLVIQNVSLLDQGLYQCGVEGRDGKQYHSQSIYLGLADIAVSDVKIALSNAFTLAGSTLASKVTESLGGAGNRNLVVRFTGVTRGGTNVFSFKIEYAGSVETREDFCTKINQQSLRDSLQKEYVVNFIDVKHYNCCVSITEGDVNFLGQYKFPVTLTGTSRDFNCSYGRIAGSNGTLSRACKKANGNPQWGDLNVLLTNCKAKTVTSEKLIELESLNIEDPEMLSKNLSAVVNEGNLTSKYDVQIVTNILQTVITKNASNSEVARNCISTVDGILNTNEELLLESNEELQTSATILNQLDELALKQEATDEAKIIEGQNIGFGILKPITSVPVVIISKAISNSNDTFQMSQSASGDADAGASDAVIVLPSEVVIKGQQNLIYSYLFKKPSLFLTRNGNISIQSVILSASVGNVKVSGLQQPVQLSFGTRKPNVTGLVNTCKFYNPNLKGTDNPWSTEGCRTIRRFGSDEVKCECDHLTNFAILMDVSQSGSNPLALQVITWVGCSISLAGLFLTILTYSFFQKLRRKLPPKILISLSVSLSAVLIIFLAGAEKTSPRAGCQAIAALLQYFILTTFCWMAIEALNLYRNFVKVFTGGSSNSKFMIRASLFSWGLPAVITLATAVSKPDNLGPAAPEHAQFCVVRGTPFYFALVLPVVIVLIGNAIVLVLVLRGIKDGSQLVKDSRAAKNKKLTQARIAFACAVLLGLTWVFAILAVGELRDFFQWMFCIFNSLQGFFIFVFYTLRSSEVRREWKKFFGFAGIDSSSSGSRYHSKYISVYRLTHSTSLLWRTKSRSSEKSFKENNNNEQRKLSSNEQRKLSSNEQRKMSSNEQRKMSSNEQRKISNNEQRKTSKASSK